MRRFVSRARRWLAALLATLIVTTGVPWPEVHAHDNDAARHFGDTKPTHPEGLDDDMPVNTDQHIHENGLLVECPGDSVSALEISKRDDRAVALPDPAIRYPLSFIAPPLRPPTRP